jgi:hypothetical protein
MVHRRPGETDRVYLARLRRIMVEARSPVEVLTPEEETRRAIRFALADVQRGAPCGYMNGARLEDYRRIEQIRRDLEDARRLGLSDVDARTAVAVATAAAIAEPWRGRWD